jgi:hypothetical protein
MPCWPAWRISTGVRSAVDSRNQYAAKSAELSVTDRIIKRWSVLTTNSLPRLSPSNTSISRRRPTLVGLRPRLRSGWVGVLDRGQWTTCRGSCWAYNRSRKLCQDGHSRQSAGRTGSHHAHAPNRSVHRPKDSDSEISHSAAKASTIFSYTSAVVASAAANTDGP